MVQQQYTIPDPSIELMKSYASFNRLPESFFEESPTTREQSRNYK